MPKGDDKKAKKNKSKKAPDKHETRNADTASSAARRGRATERPPESAEDFGHVLRRLISARGMR